MPKQTEGIRKQKAGKQKMSMRGGKWNTVAFPDAQAFPAQETERHLPFQGTLKQQTPRSLVQATLRPTKKRTAYWEQILIIFHGLIKKQKRIPPT